MGLALAAAAALTTDAAPAGSPTPFWTLWERCAASERQLLLALPEGSQATGMLKPMLLDSIASARQVRMTTAACRSMSVTCLPLLLS